MKRGICKRKLDRVSAGTSWQDRKEYGLPGKAGLDSSASISSSAAEKIISCVCQGQDVGIAAHFAKTGTIRGGYPKGKA